MKWTLTTLLCMLSLSILAQNGGPKHDPTRPYAEWSHGLSASRDYFPIAVWLQDPSNATKFESAGFNLYVGLWEGPTDAQLAALKAAGMPVICEQNKVGLAHKDDPTIVGWMHQDEPDNAQSIKDPVTGKEGYGPCIPPAHIVEEYKQLRATDPTRPIMLNLGQGVADDGWIGRGSGAKVEDYATYVQGGDIVSFDIYPVASGLKGDGENNLWYVPHGVDRLSHWAGDQRTVWNCIECTRIGGDKKPTPQQVRSEVWMALIHGSRGLIYFVHQFKPKFDEHALLDDPPMLAEVTTINRQIRELAPVLNSPSLSQEGSVQSASPQTPIDILIKRQGKTIYLFAVGMRNAATDGTFTLQNLPATAHAEVVGESRTAPIANGQFTDHFTPYAVHIYRIQP